MVSPETLRRIMPHLTRKAAATYAPPLSDALEQYDITTPARMAAFIAQIAHESGELLFWEEIWGPTEAQKGYEGRADLGNFEPGDGFRYRGRGPLQVTGRANYRACGAKLGLDLESDPDLVATPDVGFRCAALFWDDKRLNLLADRESAAAFAVITKRINGGLNGLAERDRYHAAARQAFGLQPL
jgi:putative chitinase